MWVDKLNEIKNRTRMSIKDISANTGFNEKTLTRIFSGETDNPYMTTLIPICNALGCSLDDIFADTRVVVGTEKLATLQENIEDISNEKINLEQEVLLLKSKVDVLIAENDILRMKLRHKDEELKTIYDYYHKLKTE